MIVVLFVHFIIIYYIYYIYFIFILPECNFTFYVTNCPATNFRNRFLNLGLRGWIRANGFHWFLEEI